MATKAGVFFVATLAILATLQPAERADAFPAAGTAPPVPSPSTSTSAALPLSLPASRPAECGSYEGDLAGAVNVLAPASNGATDLTLVVHGWNSNSGGEFGAIRDAIITEATSAGHANGLDVRSFDWRIIADQNWPETGGNDGRNNTIPWPPGVEGAQRVGRCLAYDVAERGYDYVHIIAHSLGTYVTDSLVTTLDTYAPGNTTHVTLLDTYIPPGASPDASTIVSNATFAEQYRHDCSVSTLPDNGGCAPFTNERLSQACNFVLNGLIPDPSNSHGFPITWYLENIDNISARWGFPLSKEETGIVPSYGSFGSSCKEPNEEEQLQWYADLSLSATQTTIGEAVTVSGTSYKIPPELYAIRIERQDGPISQSCLLGLSWECSAIETSSTPASRTYRAAVVSVFEDGSTAKEYQAVSPWITVQWIAPPPATQLAFSQQPSTGTVGVVLSPLSVQVQDATGHVAESDNATAITITKASGPGVLTCAPATVTVTAGVAVFGNCSVDSPGSYVLQATSSPVLAPAATATVVVSGPPTARLVFLARPLSGTVGVLLSPLVVQVLDVNGVVAATDNSTQITLTKVIGPGTLTCNPATVVVTEGEAKFPNCRINAAGTVSIRATSWPVVTPTETGEFPVSSQPDPLAFQSTSAGRFHTCSVVDGGSVACWGSDYKWALMANGDSSYPIIMHGFKSAVTKVSMGQDGGCVLTVAGSVECWGYYIQGGLPLSVIPSGAVDVASANDDLLHYGGQGCAVMTGGGVKCWGNNSDGQLGDGTTQPRSGPVDVVGLAAAATRVAVGWSHACAALVSGAVQCWGSGAWGALGHGSSTSSPAPVSATALADAIDVAAGSNFTCALRIGGAVSCWGDNSSGQLGDGTTTRRYSPVSVAGLTTTATAVELGQNHACVLLSNQSVSCWGANGAGQIGGPGSYYVSPRSVAGVSSAVSIGAGGGHSCAVTASGSELCWGANGWGQLGDGTTLNSSSPVAVVPPVWSPGEKLAFFEQPTSGNVGVPLSRIVVHVLDSSGVLVSGDDTTQVTVFSYGTQNFGCTPRTLTVAGGVAVFDACIVTAIGGYWLTASSAPTLMPAQSDFFFVAGPPSPRLAFATQPMSATAGASLGSVAVAVEDGSDAVVTSDQTTLVTLSAQGGSGSLFCTGGLTHQVVNGVADFTGCTLSQAGTYTLHATSSPVLTQADSIQFTMTAPPGPTGLLRVTTSPGVPSQVQVNGVPMDDWALNWVKLPPGSYTVSFSDLIGFTSPVPQTVTVTAGQVTTVQGTFVQRSNLRVVTSPPVPSTISVDGIPRNDWGLWTDLPVGSYQVCFGAVAGFNTPSCQQANLVAGQTTVITGTFTVNAGAPGPAAGYGLLRVQTSPAVPSQISVNGVPMTDWGLDWVKLAPGTYTVSFGNVSNFTSPPPEVVTVSAGQTTVVTWNFFVRGFLRVITSPPVPGTIIVNGLPREDWGMWTTVEPGSYTVCFGPATGFASTPSCQTQNVNASALTTFTGTYSP